MVDILKAVIILAAIWIFGTAFMATQTIHERNQLNATDPTLATVQNETNQITTGVVAPIVGIGMMIGGLIVVWLVFVKGKND